MNQSNALQYIPLVQALADKMLQFNKGTELNPCWVDADASTFSHSIERYRRKPLEWPPKQPEKKRAPLGPEDWMKDGPWWIRGGPMDMVPMMVVEVGENLFRFGQQGSLSQKDVPLMERSNDGINWLPCSKPAP